MKPLAQLLRIANAYDKYILEPWNTRSKLLQTWKALSNPHEYGGYPVSESNEINFVAENE
jgi:hypothetical protein